MGSRLIDPRLRRAIRDHWPSRCTIQQVRYENSASNQPRAVEGIAIPGMIDLPCILSTPVIASPGYDEKRQDGVIAEFARMILKINAYLPQIVVRDMWAVVDGDTFWIRSVESDSLNFSTRLGVEQVTL